jgi:cold shock CspA family protein
METSAQSLTFVGRVKWFNNKVGYGFITITDGPKSGTDIFVNHRKIVTDPEDQYKYLVQGEYVEFILQPAEEDGKHEFQAGKVCGIKGGKLMCETRLQVRESKVSYTKTVKEIKTPDEKVVEESVEEVKKPRSRAPPKKDVGDSKEWKRVSKKEAPKK